ncbi:MAG TPA: hypothetical protein VHQ22_07655 [Terriglobales bacterium]|nr:hypothetical protein [Terriglobales bacterium]
MLIPDYRMRETTVAMLESGMAVGGAHRSTLQLRDVPAMKPNGDHLCFHSCLHTWTNSWIERALGTRSFTMRQRAYAVW